MTDGCDVRTRRRLISPGWRSPATKADYLLGLTPDNYSKGPEPDAQRDVWFFGCDVEGTEAYIKLALERDKRRRTVVHAVVWSFHAAEYPVKYPLRESS
jgi:hypothetical protein